MVTASAPTNNIKSTLVIKHFLQQITDIISSTGPTNNVCLGPTLFLLPLVIHSVHLFFFFLLSLKNKINRHTYNDRVCSGSLIDHFRIHIYRFCFEFS